jgi:cytosine/adenosine deaminase-related metal-dependent hydrolase
LPPTSTLSCNDALGWITLRGAEALGLADRIGSLTPGKQADVILLRADTLNMRPLHDPVAAVIMQGAPANVDTVFVDGEFRKRHGKLLYAPLARRLDELDASGQRIAAGLNDLLAAH